MALLVIADRPDEFQRWWDDQLKPASADPQTAMGETLFTVRCGACHTVRGTRAGGRLGPDLTHLMSRQTLAAATLPLRAVTLIEVPGGLFAFQFRAPHLLMILASSTSLVNVPAAANLVPRTRLTRRKLSSNSGAMSGRVTT